MDPFAGIAETYDWTETGSPGEVEFWLDCAAEAGGPVLEIGAGTGRIALPLAGAGHDLVALDVSEGMLSRARHKAEAAGLLDRIDFRRGDFLDLSVDRAFGCILAPARVFEHALSPEQRSAAFAGCARHLLPSGLLALHVWGPHPKRRSREKSRYIEAGEDHKRLRFSWRTEADHERGVRTHTYRVEELEGARRSWRHDPIELAWFTAEDLDGLGGGAGLEVRHRFQDFERTPWEPGALQMIWVYTRG